MDEGIVYSECSRLTARDRQLAELGLPPLDVDPARPLTEPDWANLSKETRERIKRAAELGYRPMVHKGYLAYEKT